MTHYGIRLIGFLLSLILLPEVLAQVETSSEISTEITPEKTEEKVDEKNVERVEVTGSYIRRVDMEGPAPLTVIDQEDFLKTGSIDVADVLKEDPSFEGVYEGPGHVRFRGQNAGNVLIMLNGMRLPKQNGGYYTSIKSLPSSVLETIELLKDGGSSLYGSDAMSGVMNFKTRRDYDGAEVQTNVRTNGDGVGLQQSHVASFGKSFNKGNIMGVVQYETSEGYMEKELGSFNNSSEIARGSGSIIQYGDNYEAGERCGDDLCRFNELEFSQTRGDDEDLSALMTGSFDLPKNMKLSVLGLYNRKEATTLGSPRRVSWRDTSGNGGFSNAVDYSEFTDSAFRDSLGINPGDKVSVQATFSDELGAQERIQQTDSLNVQTQLEAYVGDTWTWQAMIGGAILNEEATVLRGEADQQVLRELFVSGQMDRLNGAIDLSSAFITPTSRTEGEMLTAKTVFTGEVFNAGGAILSAAVGAEAQYEAFEFLNDASIDEGRTLNRRIQNTSGDRNVTSVFAELVFAPVAEVELQLSGRFDNYSDVGETINPRFGFRYTPNRKMLLRGSVGTGFRAPGLTDLTDSTQVDSRFFTDKGCADPKGCRGYNVVERYNLSDLKPEEALTYGLGFVVEPYEGISFSADFWNFEGENTITNTFSGVNETDFTEYQAQFGDEFINQLGATIERDGAGNIVGMRIPRVVNLGERTLRGIDVSLNMETRNQVLPVDFGFNNTFSSIFDRSDRRFSFEDEIKRDATWKLSNTVFARSQNHYASVRLLTVSSFEDRREDFKFRQHSTFDFSYSYNTSWKGKIGVVVKNVFNQRAPVNNVGDVVNFGNPSLNLSAFSPLGRRFFMNYTQTF